MAPGPAVDNRAQECGIGGDLWNARLDLRPADSGALHPEWEIDPAAVCQPALDPRNHDGGVSRWGEGVLRQRSERPDVVAHPQRPVEKEPDSEHSDRDPPRQ